MLSSLVDRFDNYVREFEESLPQAYRGAFGAEEVRAHARVASQRGSALAKIGRFRARAQHDGAALVVVAEDRPGLLALIGAAFVLSELDVRHAEAYTRRTPVGLSEAVDVFWVREVDSRGELSDAKLGALATTLTRLLEGRLDLASALERPRRARPLEQPAQQTNVRFIEGDRGELSVLEVETFDRFGLLLALAGALFTQRVQITRSEVHTDGSRVRDRFSIVEIDGRPIQPERRLAIQVAVLSAIGPSFARSGRG